MSLSSNFKYNTKKSLNFISFYRIMAIVMLPLFTLYLILDPFFNLPVEFYHKVILIYCSLMLIGLVLIAEIEFFRKNFHVLHTVFVSGIMIISLIWFYDKQDVLGTASLIVAANLIGVVLINPKTTVWFYGSSLFLFFGLAIYFQVF